MDHVRVWAEAGMERHGAEVELGLGCHWRVSGGLDWMRERRGGLDRTEHWRKRGRRGFRFGTGQQKPQHTEAQTG